MEATDALDATAATEHPHPHDWDAIVIGRSYAGLSAALMLGRSRRTVLVVGTGGARNEMVAHAHGLLTRDHVHPSEIVTAAEADLARYPTIDLLDDRVTDLQVTDGTPGFRISMGLRHTTARHVILATGVNDDPPPIPGLADHWGRGVFTCPYCDGYEHQDLALGIVGDPTFTPHVATLLRGAWSDDVTLFATGLEPEVAADLTSRGVRIDEREVARVHGDGSSVSGIEVADGTVVPVGAIFCGGLPLPNAQLATALGATADDKGFLVVDERKATSVPDLWAVGDVRTMMHQMSAAIADGAIAGAQANAALVMERVPPTRVDP